MTPPTTPDHEPATDPRSTGADPDPVPDVPEAGRPATAPAPGASVAWPPAPAPRRTLRPWQYIVIGALIPVALIVAALVLLPMVLPLLFPDPMAQGQGPGEQQYTVTRTDLPATVTLAGTVQPTQRLDLNFTSEGEVTRVAVSVGDEVTPGSALASIDDTELRAAVTDASAEANAAWKDYQEARRSGSSVAINAMRSAHAVKDQALKEAREALEKATLTSTIDGVVAAVNVREGDLAGSVAAPGGAAPDAGTSGQAAVVVISRTYQVDASVGGAERTRLAKGMKATVTSSSSSVPLTGTITGLGVVAETSTSDGGGGDGRPSAATFPLTVTLDGQPTDVFAGSPATIDVDAGGKTGVLAVPATALIERASPTEGTVLVQRGAVPEPVQVTLGTDGGDLVEVVSGLAEGDVVLLQGDPMGMGPAGPKGPVTVSTAEPER